MLCRRIEVWRRTISKIFALYRTPALKPGVGGFQKFSPFLLQKRQISKVFALTPPALRVTFSKLQPIFTMRGQAPKVEVVRFGRNFNMLYPYAS